MRVACLLPLLMMAACGPGANAPPDGGPPLALDVSGSSQIGLHYGASMELTVRYHTDDAAATPVAGQTVRFSIFGDPAGSTLALDQAKTDADGLATVTLTAGQAEALFRVAATAINAPEADFEIAVSKLDFVELDVQLAWPTATTLRALLYDDKSCDLLPPSPTLPPPLRALSKIGAQGTLQFVNLLSKRYALVGRAEDDNGQLVGYGCVDVGAELVPPGSVSMVPVPLSTAVAVPTGSYRVTTTLVPEPASYQTLLGLWKQFGGGCPYGAAQMLLDAMGISSHRDAPLANGCRPASTTSPMSLDRQLQDLLLAPPMAPAAALPAIAGDLETILTSGTLASTLTVAPTSAQGYGAQHTLSSLTLATGTQSNSYDLVTQGEPVIDVKNVAVSDDGKTLTLGTHGFTLGWTTLWNQAFVDESLTVRVAGLGSPAIPSLVAAVVQAAARSGKTGCAAVEDLVCAVIGGSPCSEQAACLAAIDTVATTLDAPFAPTSGIDLTLAGSATPVDSDGDLQVDQLIAGTWSAPGISPSNFSGSRP